jgi:hypothetical protein
MRKQYFPVQALMASLFFMVSAIWLIQGCVNVRLVPSELTQANSPEMSNDEPEPRTISYQPPLERTPPSPYRGEVQAYLDSLRQAYLLENGDVRPIEHKAVSENPDVKEKGRNTVEGDAYDCNPTLIPLPKTKVGQFLALNRDEDSDVLLPGVFIQEQPFRNDGKLMEMPIARSPVTLSINLPVENTSRTIQNPTSSAIR